LIQDHYKEARVPGGYSIPESESRVVELLAFMERSCYAINSLRQPVEVVSRLMLNGREVAVDLDR